MPTIESETLASLLRHHRRTAGLTQEQLAERARLSVRAIRDLERGVRRAPQQQTIRLIAVALNLGENEQQALEATISRLRRSSFANTHPASIALSRLLAPLTPLVGREHAEAAIVHLLGQAEVRLLTLTGPAGVGKTRLAQQVAVTVAPQFANGVVAVALAEVAAPDRVLSAIAQGLQIAERGDQPLIQLVSAALKERSMLLILDGFEQLLGAASHVRELLDACPHLKILITSQVLLRLRGEQQYRVPPLATPDLSQAMSEDDVARYPAVVLFMQRAREMQPTFVAQGLQARMVAEICQRLGGLPLAIELAAASVLVISIPDLLRRLDDQLGLLTGGAKDLPARQQSLRTAIEWSYRLLSAREQRLLRRLALFVGGWTLEATEAICGTPHYTGDHIVRDLASLVEKSLVQSAEAQSEMRFGWLESLQQFARERLAASGELSSLQVRHAHYFLALVESAEPHLTGTAQQAWVACLEREQGNLRVALRWCSEHNLAYGLRLAGAIWRFWQIRGNLREGHTWLENLLKLAEAPQHAKIPAMIRAKALNGLGNLAYKLNDHATTEASLTAALVLFRQLGEPQGAAMALNTLGLLAHEQSAYAHAETCFVEALALHRQTGNRRGIAAVLNNLGNGAFHLGDDARAQAWYAEAVEELRLAEEPWALAVALNNLAVVLRLHGDLAQSEVCSQQSLYIARQLGDQWVKALAIKNLGDLARERGDYATTTQHYAESITLLLQVNGKHTIAECLEAWAMVAFAQHLPERATIFLGAASALRQSIASELPPREQPKFDRLVADLRAALGEQGFAVASAVGTVMTPEEAIAGWQQAQPPTHQIQP